MSEPASEPSARSERPVGARPESERSDWTEQDLLTVAEALPRLEQAITEASEELEATADPDGRAAIQQRLAAMHTARDNLKAARPL